MVTKAKKLVLMLIGCLFFHSALAGWLKVLPDVGSLPDTRISLAAYGLPADFFAAQAEKCSGQIIGYRFVVWLNKEQVAVGFNTSPNCRSSHGGKVDGVARIMVFGLHGRIAASRDIAYLADGYGEVVADGEAKAGPGGTLLFRTQSVNLDPQGANQSKSAVLLLDQNLKDVARVERFLEQTTLVNHALVFQEGFTIRGPRTYSVIDGTPPLEIQRWTKEWPVGTMDRKLGEHELAYVVCEQALHPGGYSSTNVIYAGARRRCTMHVEAADHGSWTTPLKEDGSAAILGILEDGSVAGQISVSGSPAGRLVIWKKDQTTESLPWIPHDFYGTVVSATHDLSRYATFATKESATCEESGEHCSETGRWMVFDRRSAQPIVDRVMVKNGRAALSPDGLHYASFEAGELRIYSLPAR